MLIALIHVHEMRRSHRMSTYGSATTGRDAGSDDPIPAFPLAKAGDVVRL
jgi:hypothetical protein